MPSKSASNTQKHSSASASKKDAPPATKQNNKQGGSGAVGVSVQSDSTQRHSSSAETRSTSNTQAGDGGLIGARNRDSVVAAIGGSSGDNCSPTTTAVAVLGASAAPPSSSSSSAAAATSSSSRSQPISYLMAASSSVNVNVNAVAGNKGGAKKTSPTTVSSPLSSPSAASGSAAGPIGISLRTIRSDKPVAETLPSDMHPNLNYPPPGYMLPLKGEVDCVQRQIDLRRGHHAHANNQQHHHYGNSNMNHNHRNNGSALKPPPPFSATYGIGNRAVSPVSTADRAAATPPMSWTARKAPPQMRTSRAATPCLQPGAATMMPPTQQRNPGSDCSPALSVSDASAMYAGMGDLVGGSGGFFLSTSPGLYGAAAPSPAMVPSGRGGVGDGASIDDLMDLIVEILEDGDGDESPFGSPGSGPSGGFVNDPNANWGDQASDDGRRGAGGGGGSATPCSMHSGSFAGLMGGGSSPSRARQATSTPLADSVDGQSPTPNSRPAKDNSPPSDSSPPTLPRRMPAQHTSLPDVVATADGIKRLILAPHVPHKPLTLLAHRIGPTLLLEGTNIDGTDVAVSVEDARRKALRHKLLYYSVLMSPPVAPGGSGGGGSGGKQSSPFPSSGSAAGSAASEGNDSSAANTSRFRKALQWNLSDMNILIGATQPTLADRATGQEVNLQMHDTRALLRSPPPQSSLAVPRVTEKSESADTDSNDADAAANSSALAVSSSSRTSPTKPNDAGIPLSEGDGDEGVSVGISPAMPKLDQASALEYWLDNILSNVASVALCYHRDGDVQGYQVVPTHNLPQLSDPAFSPMAVQSSSTQVLKWLKEGTSTGGTSFVVVKDRDSTELKLFDITGLSTGGVKDMLMQHPDARSRAVTAGGGTGLTAAAGTAKGSSSSSEPVTSNALVVVNRSPPPPPPSGVSPSDPNSRALVVHSNALGGVFPSGKRGSSRAAAFLERAAKASPAIAAVAASGQFGMLKYPYAVMCFRMAQCMDPSSNDAFRLWQRVASLLSIDDDEAHLPLAIAHVNCMLYYCSPSAGAQKDADRQAITHASRAVQCLHAFNRSVKTLLLPADVLLGAEEAAAQKRKKGSSTVAEQVTEENVAQLLEDAIRGDADVTAMVGQMRGLCIKIVTHMAAMGERELKQFTSNASQPNAVSGSPAGPKDAPSPAVVLGRVVENILVAQAALMLRAFEVPSGLIMANPDTVAVSSEVSSVYNTGTGGRGTLRGALDTITNASAAPRAHSDSPTGDTESLNASSSGGPTSCSSPHAREHATVVACFERLSTLAADVVSSHLQHVLESATADAANPSHFQSPSAGGGGPGATAVSPTTGTGSSNLERYTSKLRRDLKVTFSVMSGIASSSSALGDSSAPPESSITGASVPDHANFVGGMLPLGTNPLEVAEMAERLYQRALGHSHARVGPSNREASKPLKRKLAAIYAILAEFYVRGLASALIPKDGAAMAPSPSDSLTSPSAASPTLGGGGLSTAGPPSSPTDASLMAPWRDSQDAYAQFERAAAAFSSCNDLANAALNHLNASKMCLRAAQALVKLKAIRQMQSGKTAAEREAAAAEDNAAIEELHRKALDSLAKADHLPKGGASGVPAAIADNVKQFTFSVYVYAFQFEAEQLTVPTEGPPRTLTTAHFASLHDRYLAPALRVPKKLGHLMSAETQRSMEAKVLSLMISLYWVAYPGKAATVVGGASSSSASSSAVTIPANAVIVDGPIAMTLADRVACVRFAKTRLRQFWTNYLQQTLTSNNTSIPYALWAEGTRVMDKMVACDLYLFTHGAVCPSSSSATGGALPDGAPLLSSSSPPPSLSAASVILDQVQCIEWAFTSIVDWRRWLRMAEMGRVVVPQPASATSDARQPSPPQPQGKGGKQSKQQQQQQQQQTSAPPTAVVAPASSLTQACMPIAKHLCTTLMGLLRLMKQQPAANSGSAMDVTGEAIKRSLAISTNEPMGGLVGNVSDAARISWLKQLGKCVDDAEKIFNGRRSR